MYALLLADSVGSDVLSMTILFVASCQTSNRPRLTSLDLILSDPESDKRSERYSHPSNVPRSTQRALLLCCDTTSDAEKSTQFINRAKRPMLVAGFVGRANHGWKSPPPAPTFNSFGDPEATAMSKSHTRTLFVMTHGERFPAFTNHLPQAVGLQRD